MGIAIYEVVYVRLDAHTFQTFAELVGSILTIVVCDNYGTNHEVAVHELFAQSQHVFIIGDT